MARIKLKDLLAEGSFQLRQYLKQECPLCKQDISGGDNEPGTTANIKLFGASKWSICPHCGNPVEGNPENDMQWKIDATTYLYKNYKDAFNNLDSMWKKEWIQWLFSNDRKTFRQITRKR